VGLFGGFLFFLLAVLFPFLAKYFLLYTSSVLRGSLRF
jgi:hypothetical protein